MKPCENCKELRRQVSKGKTYYFWLEEQRDEADSIIHEHLKLVGRESCNRMTCDLSHWLEDLKKELEILRKLEFKNDDSRTI